MCVCGVVWCVVWFGVCGLVWCVWFGVCGLVCVVWFGVVWCGVCVCMYVCVFVCVCSESLLSKYVHLKIV